MISLLITLNLNLTDYSYQELLLEIKRYFCTLLYLDNDSLIMEMKYSIMRTYRISKIPNIYNY